MFLPEPSVREQLILPSSVHIDYRAACFCHRRLVDIGFVCSVCLSSKTYNTLKAIYFDLFQIGRSLKVKVYLTRELHCKNKPNIPCILILTPSGRESYLTDSYYKRPICSFFSINQLPFAPILALFPSRNSSHLGKRVPFL